jgi:antitoxin FitA
MATITIRNLPEETKSGLRIRAAENGVSMEEEARRMLIRGNAQMRGQTIKKGAWVKDIRALFKDVGNLEIELPERAPFKPSVDFSGPEFDP